MGAHFTLGGVFDEIDALPGGVAPGLERGHAIAQRLGGLEELAVVCGAEARLGGKLVVIITEESVCRCLPVCVGNFEDVGVLIERLVVVGCPGTAGDVGCAAASEGDALDACMPDESACSSFTICPGFVPSAVFASAPFEW
jgi:hypothetical protein